jgi:transcriptional regulator with XRE-family HTH domain
LRRAADTICQHALVRARETKGVTQTELAARLGRPQSFVSNYENGQRRIDVIEFIQIAKALGLDPAEVPRLAGK